MVTLFLEVAVVMVLVVVVVDKRLATNFGNQFSQKKTSKSHSRPMQRHVKDHLFQI